MRPGSHKGKRKRFATKTRTGCPNCRRRHIKCDEGRPACQKCVRSELVCEGYDSNPKPKIFRSQKELVSERGRSHAFIVWEPGTGMGEKGKDKCKEKWKRDELEAKERAVIVKAMTRRSPSPVAGPALFSPQAARTISFWLSRTRSLMVKSDVGSVFWSSIVPQAAWTFQPIQDALNATVIVHESLDRGEDESAHRKARLLAAMHVNKAARGLIESSPSPEEAMIMAAALWCYGMISGEYVESLLHLNHAKRIAYDEKKRRNGTQSLPTFYLDNLVDSFPGPLNPGMVNTLGPTLMQAHIKAMIANAAATLRHLIMALEIYQPLVINSGPVKDSNVISVMQITLEMAQWMLSLLRESSPDSPEYTSDLSHDPQLSQKSPFTAILDRVQKYLLTGDEEELRHFANDLQASWGVFQMAVASDSLPILRAVLEFYKIRPLDWTLTNRSIDMAIKLEEKSPGKGAARIYEVPEILASRPGKEGKDPTLR